MRRFVGMVLMAGAIVFGAAIGEARADLIAYTTTGTGSGRLGSTNFTNQAFTITMIADTTQVQDLGFSFGVNNISTTIQLGSTNLTSVAGSSYSAKTTIPAIAQFSYSGARVGEPWEDPNFNFFNTGLLGFDLKTPVGPLAISPNYGPFLETDQGSLSFSSTSGMQFRATIVPEPASLALAASGGLVVWGWYLRRRRSGLCARR